MCRRKSEPYLGLLNFPGGKAEPGEEGLAAAYRELYEETSLSRGNLRGPLLHLLDFSYPTDGIKVEVYAGRLAGEADLKEEKHPLLWVLLDGTDFFDTKTFAGEGNIGHIILHMAMKGI